jgi:hypothetical protein
LLSPSEVADGLAYLKPPTPNTPLPTNLASRVVLGVVVASGFQVVLLDFARAMLGQEISSELLTAFRWAAILPGALLSGAGRPSALWSGGLVGLVCGVAWWLVDQFPAMQVGISQLIELGILLGFSAVASVIGRRIWPPANVLPEVEEANSSSLIRKQKFGEKKAPASTIQWIRVMVVSALIVGTFPLADPCRELLRKMPAGMFQVYGPAAPKVNFEINLLLLIVAAFFAGAGTRSPLKHALLVAVIATCGAMSLIMSMPGQFTGIDWFVEHLAEDFEQTERALAMSLAVVITFFGWVGGQLLPPLSQQKSRRRTDLA